MKTQRTSYGFLMEMLWVCAFFLISACIFVLAFAKSEKMSRDAETLNQAVLAASNAMEETFALYEGKSAESAGTAPMDDGARTAGAAAAAEITEADDAIGTAADIEALAASCGTDAFSIVIDADLSDSLLQVTVQAVGKRDGSVIYTLEGSHFLPESKNQLTEKGGILQ